MKKKPEEKEAELREQIIAQATRLFKIFGYQKLVLEDISRAIGKSRTTLYIYYKDKEAIFNAIIEREIQLYLHNLEVEVAKHSSAAEQLQAYFLLKFDFRNAKADEYKMLTQEMTRQPEILAKMRVYSDKTELAILSGIIRRGIDLGEFEQMPDNQIYMTGELFISALHGISNDVTANLEAANTSLIRELLVRLFTNTLARKA